MISLVKTMIASTFLGPVLVVSGDLEMRSTIVAYLEGHDFRTVALTDPETAIQQIEHGAYGLVLLDVQLGLTNNLDGLRGIRERSNIPVIIVTNERQDDIDCIVGLELGADDCIARPLQMRELLARAWAVVRRQELGRLISVRPQRRGGYRFAGWKLRFKGRQLTNPAGYVVALTKSEYNLLTAFLETPDRALSREQLLHLTRTHEDIYDRSIDVQVLRLRRKLDVDSAKASMIRTERGVGYSFNTPVERLL